MRTVLLVLLLLSGAAWAGDDFARCTIAVRAMKGAPPSPAGFPLRQAYVKACAPIFSDQVYREAMQTKLLQFSEFDHAHWMLAVATGEGERNSYCWTTQSKDVGACVGTLNSLQKLSPAESNKQWRVLLARVLVLELGQKKGAELMADFENSWTSIYPLKP